MIEFFLLQDVYHLPTYTMFMWYMLVKYTVYIAALVYHGECKISRIDGIYVKKFYRKKLSPCKIQVTFHEVWLAYSEFMYTLFPCCPILLQSIFLIPSLIHGSYGNCTELILQSCVVPLVLSCWEPSGPIDDLTLVDIEPKRILNTSYSLLFFYLLGLTHFFKLQSILIGNNMFLDKPCSAIAKWARDREKLIYVMADLRLTIFALLCILYWRDKACENGSGLR